MLKFSPGELFIATSNGATRLSLQLRLHRGLSAFAVGHGEQHPRPRRSLLSRLRSVWLNDINERGPRDTYDIRHAEA